MGTNDTIKAIVQKLTEVVSDLSPGSMNTTDFKKGIHKLDRKQGEARGSGMICSLLNKSIGNLKLFLNIDAHDPDRILQRCAKLKDSCNLLGFARQIEFSSTSKDKVNRVIEEAQSQVKAQNEALSTVNNFYRKNSARIDHQMDQQIFSKSGDYPLYKRMVTNHFDMKLIRKYGFTNIKYDSKMTQHYRNEVRDIKLKDYANWLQAKNDSYKDKTTAWTVTRYVLEKELGVTTKSIGNHKSFNWSLSGEKKEFADHQLRFIGGLLFAAYTVKEDKHRGFVAYPGIRNKGNFYHNVYPLHTDFYHQIQIGTQQVKFMSREPNELHPFETPCSLKYVMRHNKLFITEYLGKSQTHGRASDYKSIQSAGGLVAFEGKVVAIDNLSGHYEPGWKLLRQAVEKIKSEYAFADNAVVGVYYGKENETLFFPVKVFLNLADSKFDAKALPKKFVNTNPVLPSKICDLCKNHIKKGFWTQKKHEDLKNFLLDLESG